MSAHLVNKNKKAYFDYQIIETFEAGLVLTGPEIKSIRSHDVSIKEAFVLIRKQEAFVINMNVKKYSQTHNVFGFDSTRTRKLLLNKKEIKHILKKIKLENLTLVPLKIYLKNNYAKLEIALAKGKNLYDKRQAIKKRDVERKDLAGYAKVY